MLCASREGNYQTNLELKLELRCSSMGTLYLGYVFLFSNSSSEQHWNTTTAKLDVPLGGFKSTLRFYLSSKRWMWFITVWEVAWWESLFALSLILTEFDGNSFIRCYIRNVEHYVKFVGALATSWYFHGCMKFRQSWINFTFP